MGKCGTSNWVGKSGEKYTFDTYTLDTVFNGGIESNYIFAKPAKDQNVIYPIYIGEGILKDRIEYRINEGRVQQKGCDRVCIMRNNSERSRKFIEGDLLAAFPSAYEPLGCNIKKGG